MELLFALTLGLLTSCGIYLMLRARTFPVVVGLTLLSYAVNLFLFGMGRLVTGMPAVIGRAPGHADPLPQALVLTAIVITFGMTALIVVLSLRSFLETGTDDVGLGAGVEEEAASDEGER